jgi:hypothetical protein
LAAACLVASSARRCFWGEGGGAQDQEGAPTLRQNLCGQSAEQGKRDL